MTKTQIKPEISIIGRGRDEVSTFYTVLNVTRGQDSSQMTAVNEALFAEDTRKIGKDIHNTTALLLPPERLRELKDEAIENSHQTPTFEVLTRTGWNKERSAFLKPNRLIDYQNQGGKIISCLSGNVHELAERYSPRGQLEGWRQVVSSYAKGNSRAILALCASFAGPIAPLLGVEPFIISFVGKGGKGKTSLGVLASLAWGAHSDPDKARARGCGSSAKITINELDTLYAANSHMFLLLDELSALVPGSMRTSEAIPDFINAHALGDQKARMTDGGFRASWSTMVLLTSNEHLSRLCPQLDEHRRDALLDRYIEIPGIGEDGAFIEALHGHPAVERFAVAMKNSALAVAGIAADTLVEHLVNHLAKNRAGVLKTLRRKMAVFRREARHIRVNARRKTRFALLYAAGTAARIAKVMPLEDDEIKQALLTCLEDHVRHVTASAPLAPLDTLDVARALVRFREQAKASIPIANGRDKVGPLPFGLDYNGRSRQEWLLPSKAFDAALTGITTPVKARALLAAAGLIVVEREGPERRYVVKRRVGLNEDGTAQAVQVTAILLENLVAFASSHKA